MMKRGHESQNDEAKLPLCLAGLSLRCGALYRLASEAKGYLAFAQDAKIS